MLSTPLTICPSAEAMQRMPQRGKGLIETKRENSINKLRSVIVTKQVVEKLLPGQLVVDPVDRDRTPCPMQCGSLFVFQRTTTIHMAHAGEEAVVAQMHHVPHSVSVDQ